MEKDYRHWHFKKLVVNSKKNRVFFHEREIWFSHVGVNIGFEQDGKGQDFGRPVIIFRKFTKETFWAIPLTTKIKSGNFYFPVSFGDGISRLATLPQMKLMDSKRLYQKIRTLDEETYRDLKKKIIELCK